MKIFGYKITKDDKAPTKKVYNKGGKGSIIDSSTFERETFTLSEWQNAVSVAEDVERPSRIELARLYKNIIDDDTVWQVMQTRIANAIIGKITFQDSEGNELEEVQKIFTKPDGNAKQWFRQWMKLQIEKKFYGAILLQFGAVKNGGFSFVKMVDYQNVIPEKNNVIINIDYGVIIDGTNTLNFTDNKYKSFCYLAHDGDPRSLGLLNKIAPYYIWKNESLGNWSMFQELFGLDTKIGKTDTTDVERKKNMDNALANTRGADWLTIHTEDSVEFVSSSKPDAYNTYKEPVNYYDKAINKIVLSNTSLSEDKSFVGAVEVQERAGDNIKYLDKIDISDAFESELLPFMQRSGLLAEQEVYLVWDMSENVSMLDMATIIEKLAAHYDIDEDIIEKKFNMSVEKKETDSNIVETTNKIMRAVYGSKDI